MTSRPFVVAAAQLRLEPDNPTLNRAKTVAAIEHAAGMGAALVVLPELSNSGYVFRDRAHAASIAESVPDGATVELWAAAAKNLGLYVVGGVVEREHGELYNTAVLLGPRGYLGRYRKTHLFATEKLVFRPGDDGLPVFETPLGVIGLLVCFDLRFPEAPRVLALQGAHLICVPTTWTNLYKPDPWDDRGFCMANYLALAHAYVNRCYVVCADRVGQEAEVTYLGASIVVGPDGSVAAGPASRWDEEIIVAEVDIDRARDKRLGDYNNLFADRRPELYTPLVGAQKFPGAPYR